MHQKFFTGLTLLIIGLSIFFRTYNYTDRAVINADNSRDVQVSLFAADNLKLPLIGQFSSAGPFFYGPWWYWFLGFIAFFPLGFFTHWYFMTLLSFVFIAGLYYLGSLSGGKWLGALAALFAAISPAQIDNSFAAWNPSIIPLLALLSLIFLVKYYYSHKIIHIFLLGFTVGLALTIHFQSMLILPTMLLAAALIRLPVIHYLQHISVLAIGLIIPFIPMIQFDSQFNWQNFKNIFFYLTVGQYNIWVPNRWLTYAGKYWPETWASIIGGRYLLGLIIIALLAILFVFKLKIYKHNIPFYLVTATFILEIILYRYYRGERFVYYSLFAYPSVILLTAWVTYQLFKIKPILGIVLGSIVFFTTFKVSISKLQPTPISFSKVNQLRSDIYSHYHPFDAFDIYACKHYGTDLAHPLALLIYRDNRNQDNGIKIEVCMINGQPSWRIFSKPEIKNLGREQSLSQPVTTAQVFKDTVEWWK